LPLASSTVMITIYHWIPRSTVFSFLGTEWGTVIMT
jgi:hypothetical protein